MTKSTDAFRSISEVADELDVPKHVLRFWEMRFPQIKPMKRGGGRRYYRPADVDLLKGIRHLLHAEGYTIKGVQKIFRDQGPDEVQKCWRAGGSLPVERAVTPSIPRPSIPPASAKRPTRATIGDAATVVAQRRRVLLSIHAELTACRDQLVEALGRNLPPSDASSALETAALAKSRVKTRARSNTAAADKPAKKRSGL